MTNSEIATIFDQLSDLLEFRGANPFRVRAYRNAARIVRDLCESIGGIVEDPQRKLTDIAGIGNDLAEKIETLVATGRLPMLDELLKETPSSVMALLRIPGLGPKRAAVLHKELNVKGLEDLRAACEAGRVRGLKGFGEKTEKTILAGLDVAATAEVRTYWASADQIVQLLLDHMRKSPAAKRVEMAGSYRRGRETVGDLDLLVDSTEPHAVMDHFAQFGGVEAVLARGDTKMSVRLTTGMQLDLRVVPEESFGAALQYFTGSKDHNVVLRGLAKQRGLKISEWGVFAVSGAEEKYVAGRTEAEVYATLDLPYFPPELREARQEFQWAAAGALPDLITVDDIRGDLHMHTTATDGKATLEEMVEAAQARGLKYIAITDHSKRVSMAGGLDATRLRRQWEEIDRLNETLSGFTILKGIECDILEKGGLDLSDDVLADADWVVVSVHYGQNQPKDRITKRIVDALANPHVSALAHPTGRLIGRREPYAVDLNAVMETAHAHHKLMELNANPARLDLDDVACAIAKRNGIPIVISTDAHSINGLDTMRYGVLQARRGGLTKDDVANTRSWTQLKKLLQRGD
ncbi:MAG: DNA polymerase/3'-5' exonuclease PolX [Pirellulales bacterium]